MQKTANILVADVYFSKYPFIESLTKSNFTLISRLQDDAVLHHCINQEKTGKPGHPKTKGERVNFKDLSQFEMVSATAINIAKAAHWDELAKQKRKAFSMADIKTLNNNQLLPNRFICMFAIKPNMIKNKTSKNLYSMAQRLHKS